MKAAAALFAALLLGSSALAQDFNPKLSPELNKPYKFLIKMNSGSIETGQGSLKLGIQIVAVSTFTEMTEDTITSKDKVEDFKLFFNDKETNITGGNPAALGKELTVVQKRNGQVVSREKPEGGGPGQETPPRYQKMMEFSLPDKPIKAGESWIREVPADEKAGVVEARAKYTYEGTEQFQGRTLYRIAAAYSELVGEKPMGMVGKVWVDAATGIVERIDADLNDVSLSPMMPAMNMKFSLERVQ